MSDRILVFIPAYRCERQIGRVLEQFGQPGRAERFAQILVLDNRSPDGTVAAAQEAGRTLRLDNLLVGRNHDNYGLGGSHKAAFRYAVQEGFTHVVVLHGDDQADIADLMPLLARGEHLEKDCCLGARFHPASKLQGYSRTRMIGNVAFNALFSTATGKRLYDLGSGLNIYSTAMLRDEFYKRLPDNLMFNYGMILASSVKAHNISFFPITWREEDQVSNVKLFSQAYRTMALLRGFVADRRNFLAKEHREKARDEYSFEICS
ncbi:MAG TPA: glycosyltransferase family 2 protein [Mesorhizobium sp.]|jgi:glycosyltransferase involved in cell wall biosynthesis|nr:glycosyltransferase family 2 protein [Mesorhizobium sp.]